jgi:hypothetical protein
MVFGSPILLYVPCEGCYNFLPLSSIHGASVTRVTVVVQGKVVMEVVKPDPSVAVPITVDGGNVAVVLYTKEIGAIGVVVLNKPVPVWVHKFAAYVAYILPLTRLVMYIVECQIGNELNLAALKANITAITAKSATTERT